jgi:hypothetical protein
LIGAGKLFADASAERSCLPSSGRNRHGFLEPSRSLSMGEDQPVTTDWPPAYEEALAAAEPTVALREAVVRAREAGLERDVVEGQLRALREHLQRAGRDRDEDVVLEIMDFLAGWSSPHMKID